MKTNLHLILFISLVFKILSLSGQWTPYGKPTNEAINAMFNINDSNIWAVGNNGIILKFNGESWEKISLPFLIEENFKTIFFTNNSTGYIGGENGTLLKYQNGAWLLLGKVSNSGVNDIFIRSNNTGWMASWNIYYYDGNSFTEQILPGGNAYIYDIHFINDSMGWAVGYRSSDYKGIIYKYYNSSWHIDTVLSSGNILSIQMFENGTGWASGSNSNVYYYDGNTWQKQVVDSTYLYDYFQKIYFTDPENGWLLSYYYIYEYKNGNWTKYYIQDNFKDIIQTSSEILACSGTGNIYRFENDKWEPIFEKYSGFITLKNVNNYSWVLSNDGIYKYINKTLIPDTLVTYANLSDIFFIDSTLGYAVGYNKYLKYTNGSWEWHSFPYEMEYPYLLSVYFIDSTLGWAVGNNGVILKYENGKWYKQNSITNEVLKSVWFTSHNEGWAVGSKGIILHYTNGQWTVYPKLVNSYLNSVCFSDAENGWIVGENQTILQYKNGKWTVFSKSTYGKNYTRVSYNRNRWFIVGSMGTILHWDGTNWEDLPTNTNQTLNAIAFLDSINGIAISNSGIYETNTAGLPPYQNKTSIELLGTFNRSLILSNDTIKIIGEIQIYGSLILKNNVKVVEFEGPYKIYISNGKLIAKGNPDNPIKFTVADSILLGSNNRWEFIYITNNSNDESIINNCYFKHCKYALNLQNGKISVDKCTFEDVLYYSIYLNNLTESKISNNIFKSAQYASVFLNQSNNIVLDNNIFTDHSNGYALNIYNCTNITVDKSTIYNNTTYNLIMIVASDVKINLSKICNNNGGIALNNSKLIINNSLIANNNLQNFYESSSNFAGLIFANNSQLDILNSTLVNNKFPYAWGYPGATLIYYFSNGNVYNSILWDNYIYDNDSASYQPYQIYIYNNTSRPNFFYSNIQGGLNYLRKNTGVNFYGIYANNHSNSPTFVNPTTQFGNGTTLEYNALLADWSLNENSPNINKGTLNLELLSLMPTDLNDKPRILNGIVDIGAYESKVKPIEITVCDTILTNTTWATDTVRIKNCNVVIAPNTTLTIAPGTRVEFWGPYKFIVQGNIKAIGNANEPIIFTIHDTTGFITNKQVGWKGIEFDNSTGTLDNSDSSIFKNCIFNFAKDTVGLYYQGMGIYGIIKAKFFSKIYISNCLFENNIAPYDSILYTTCAIINIRNTQTIKIEKNKFKNNSGCIINSDFGSILFNDNLICYNKTFRGQNLFNFSNTELTFSKNFINNNKGSSDYYPLINIITSNIIFTNNILVNNNDTGINTYYYFLLVNGGKILFNSNTVVNNNGVINFYNTLLKAHNNIIWQNKDFWFYNLSAGSSIKNNIITYANQYSNYEYFDNNLDQDPIFMAPSTSTGIYSDGLSANWQLNYLSPAINAGVIDTSGMFIPKWDLAGNKRINGDVIDLGAYEHTGSKVQFVQNPTGGSYCLGDSIALVVKVNTLSTLQWQKDGIDIPGASDSILILSNLNELHSGNYVCKATNAYGSVYSIPAFIQVSVAPEIFTQPSTQWLNENESDIITVTATGTKPLKYYWYFNNNLLDSTLSGKLNISNAYVNNEGTYYCKVTNHCGSVQTEAFGVYLKPQICLVTADTETGKNVVVWERKNGRPIKGYNVYRESMVKDVYEKLGYVDYLSPGVFVDSTSRPETRQYLYKIAIVTENDEVSPLSPYHKTLFLQYVSAIEGINLIWQPYTIENGSVEFKSYVLYKGTDSIHLQPFDTVSSNITAYTDKDPNSLQKLTYYRVAGILYNPCHSEELLKAGGGPFVEVLSNIEDNRLRSSGGGTHVDQLNNLNITLYPQPAKKYLNVAFFLKNNTTIKWEIIDIQGSKIVSNQTETFLRGNNRLTIDLSAFSITSGLFILRIYSSDGMSVSKFVVAN